MTENSLRTSCFANRRDRVATLACALAVCWSIVPHGGAHAQPPTGSQTAALLARANAARDANADQLRSAVAAGTLRHVLVRSDQGHPTTLIDADFELVFDAPRWLLRIQYTTLLERPAAAASASDPPWVDAGIARRFLWMDGEALVVVDCTTEEQWHGRIYFESSRQTVLPDAGFPSGHPLHLWLGALDTTREELRGAVTTPLSGGGFVGRLDRGAEELKFYLFGDFGYDLRRVSLYRSGDPQPMRDCLLHWHRVGEGQYYVERFVAKTREAIGVGDTVITAHRREELAYTSFESNARVDPSRIDLGAIGIPLGTRFTDRRANVETRPRILVYRGGEVLSPL